MFSFRTAFFATLVSGAFAAQSQIRSVRFDVPAENIAAIAQDKRYIDQAIALIPTSPATPVDWATARNIYNKGAFVDPVITLTLTSPFPKAIEKGFIITINGIPMSVAVAYDALKPTLKLVYPKFTELNESVNCALGGLKAVDQITVGCIVAPTGTSSTFKLEGKDYSVSWKALVNSNDVSLKGYATKVFKPTATNPTAINPVFENLVAYTGQPDVLHRFINYGLFGTTTLVDQLAVKPNWSSYSTARIRANIVDISIRYATMYQALADLETAIEKKDPAYVDHAFAKYAGSLADIQTIPTGRVAFESSQIICGPTNTCVRNLTPKLSISNQKIIEDIKATKDAIILDLNPRAPVMRIKKQLMVTTIQQVVVNAYRVVADIQNIVSQANLDVHATILASMIHKDFPEVALKLKTQIIERPITSPIPVNEFTAILSDLRKVYPKYQIECAEVGVITAISTLPQVDACADPTGILPIN